MNMFLVNVTIACQQYVYSYYYITTPSNKSNEKVNERALDLIQEICRKLPITTLEYSLEK